MADAIGLSHAEAARRLEARGPVHALSSSRSTRAIVRDNTLTLFNLILLGFAAALVAVGDFADLLFVGIVVVNASVGILQELRAKRQLDRLALLVAPRARVIRDGETSAVPVEGVVQGDAVRLEPGEQVVADGPLLESRSLQLDESVLTGEADPVSRGTGDEVRSGSFCVAGGGVYRADQVGVDAYASTLTETARADRRDLSPLQRDINRLLRLMIAVMVPIAALLIAALRYHATPIREAVSTATAGCVTLVPEGLVLLASVAFAVGAARMARRGALVQRLSAVESLAGVDVVCVDKTGTLTDGTLALDEIVPLAGHSEAEVRAALGAFATSLAGRNPTADAIATALGGRTLSVSVEVPFSSRWKWSGLTLTDGETQVLGAPDVLLHRVRDPGSIAAEVDVRARRQRRVLLFARGTGTLEEVGEGAPDVPLLEPIGLIALTERMRDQTIETIAYLRNAGVAVKVISGDGPVTVDAVAQAAGLDTAGRVITGDDLPKDGRELGLAAERCVVFARIQPDQKRALVEALVKRGRRVAMIGDGVNDVPALKASQVAIALGSGSQIAKGVADLVLVGLNFAAIPAAIEEGRKILRNVRRVAKLFVAKSVFAAVLILTIGIGGGAYPFLPRQLSLAAAFTVGLPTFFLALAPPPPERRGRGFLREVLAFALPAGVVLGLAVLLGNGLVHTALNRSPSESQTTSTTILILVGLYLVLVLESTGMRTSVRRARAIPALCLLLVIAYVAMISLGPLRSYFALAPPSTLPVLVSLICTVFAIGALGAVGLSLTRPGGERVQLVVPFRRTR
ncbi:MAG: HAD-IC family P-type ATPase [Gaiellales bacterium]